jgi:rod shape-determining protein MreC
MQSVFSFPRASIYAFPRKNKTTDATVRMQNEIIALHRKVADYELLIRENEALRSQFEASGSLSQSLLAAKILGFTGNNKMPETLVIDAGQKSQIKNGMAVIFQGNLVGKISAVSQNFSVVDTVLNSNFQVLAKLPETNAYGILEGKKDLMLFDRIVITDTLQKNAEVVTKGEVNDKGIGIFPDLIIGKITSISKKETSPFQSAEVSSIIDLSRLTDVFVVIAL